MKIETIEIPSINATIDYIVGQNAQDNHDIIDDAADDDIWFHVDNRSSCHVIAKLTENFKRKEMRYIIKQGAVLCKKHSYPNIKNLPIISTKIKHLIKTDIPGQVITKPELHSIITI